MLIIFILWYSISNISILAIYKLQYLINLYMYSPYKYIFIRHNTIIIALIILIKVPISLTFYVKFAIINIMYVSTCSNQHSIEYDGRNSMSIKISSKRELQDLRIYLMACKDFNVSKVKAGKMLNKHFFKRPKCGVAGYELLFDEVSEAVESGIFGEGWD